MPTATELRIQRRLTAELIDAMAVSLVLVPRTKTNDGSGGWTWGDGTPRAAQTFHMIEFGGEGSAGLRPVRTADGTDRYASYEMLGSYDATIGLWDHFTFQGERCEVVEMFRDNGWERRALIASFGNGGAP